MQTPTSLDIVMQDDRQVFHHVNVLARDTGWLHPPVLDQAGDGLVLFAGLLLVGAVTVVGFLLVRRPAVALVDFMAGTPMRPLLATGLRIGVRGDLAGEARTTAS